MRVLHVCEILSGGPATYLQELLPAQLRRYGADRIGVLAPQDQLSHLPQEPGLKVHGYARAGRDLRSCLALSRSLLETIHAFEPDLVHAHCSFAGAVVRASKAICAWKAAVVYCAHCWAFDPYRESRLKPLYGILERALVPWTDALVNVSPHEQIVLACYGFPRDKIRCVVTGIAQDPPARPVSGSGPLRLLFLGRFDRQKGLDLLLAQMRAIPPALAELRVVGARVLNDTSREPDHAPNVTFGGWAQRSQVPGLIADHDAVVMPSRWEGFPQVALEAMRAGRAIIASSRGPFLHLVEHETTGVLLDFQEDGALARSLEQHDRPAMARMGVAARIRFDTHYLASRMNEEILQVYERIAKEARVGRGDPDEDSSHDALVNPIGNAIHGVRLRSPTASRFPAGRRRI
jgi:glycosyltransferase involved in cell wall biosynthesis